MSEFKLPEEFIESSKALHVQRVRTATSIGLLVIQFNRLEYDLGEFLGVFLKRKNQEEHFENIAIMTAALSFGQKLDLLSALYLKRYREQPKQCEIFKRIILQMSKYEEYRNSLVHSRWGTQTFGDSEFKRFKSNIKGRKGLRKVAELADWRQIRTICTEMQSFNCIEMLEIYRGCARYEAMSEETINRLSVRMTERLSGALQAAGI
ncbi:hypothetical protein [Hydrogenophaga sp. T2]|uniref:hypothetical protein n=1 Tax=Hydrogenophaga sp. T2 TaxID=3132823 RepID=UPI003CF96E79